MKLFRRRKEIYTETDKHIVYTKIINGTKYYIIGNKETGLIDEAYCNDVLIENAIKQILEKLKGEPKMKLFKSRKKEKEFTELQKAQIEFAYHLKMWLEAWKRVNELNKEPQK